MGNFPPTPEQQAIIDGFATGKHLTVEAGAGTGKTTTLRMLAETTERRGAYFAYNRAIAADAKATFPGHVECRTLHGFAYGAVKRSRGFLLDRMNLPRQNSYAVAKLLGITGPKRITDDVVLAPQQVASIVMETIRNYCMSGEDHVIRRHMPVRAGLDSPEAKASLAEVVGPYARKAWEDVTSATGKLRTTHDHYRKVWALARPRIGADYLFVDEAQDSDGLTMELVRQQAEYGAQIIVVGDSNQAIYGWRGATSAMAMFEGARLPLSQSWRFGPAVAEEANAWLTALESRLRLRGAPNLDTRIGDLTPTTADAVLCRTNATAVSTLMTMIDQGVPAHIVGGGDQIRRLAVAANELRERGSTSHPELCAFVTWAQVQDYVEHDGDGSDLAVAVKLIDEHGTDKIIDVVDAMVDERDARVVISTAHKAKGREWGRVLIADDFPEPKKDDDGGAPKFRKDEGMLAYVAVTRAQGVLDNSGLAWIHDYLAGTHPAASAAA